MIAIVDYGVGNLFSLRCSFGAIGQEIQVTSDPSVIRNADKIILPGVGAFEDAIKKLNESGMGELVKEAAKLEKPVLGICLGMQLLLEKSFEYGEHNGLGLISGNVRPIADVIPDNLKIPQMGWNALSLNQKGCPIFKYINEGDHFYFVHSYYCESPENVVAATCEYGAMLTAAVASANVYGCQFHPEKSGKAGLKILKAFCEL